MYSVAAEWNILHMQVISILVILLYKFSVSLLIFCLDDQSIFENGVLKSPTIIVLLSVCPFSSVNICFVYC